MAIVIGAQPFNKQEERALVRSFETGLAVKIRDHWIKTTFLGWGRDPVTGKKVLLEVTWQPARAPRKK